REGQPRIGGDSTVVDAKGTNPSSTRVAPRERGFFCATFIKRTMPGTLGLALIMAYGAFLGAALAYALGGDFSAMQVAAAVVRDVTTAIGIVVGGWWAYRKYFQKREAIERADLVHQVS